MLNKYYNNLNKNKKICIRNSIKNFYEFNESFTSFLTLNKDFSFKFLISEKIIIF